MSFWDVLAIVLAGTAAGTINTIVGSGSLITFPTLLVLGYPPLVANMSNAVGLLPGGLSGSFGYRRELTGQGPTLARLLPMSILGSLAGALLLLVLPPEVFDAVVPALITLGIILVVAGPRIQRAAALRTSAAVGEPDADGSPDPLPAVGGRRLALATGIFLAGVYGGYFGAAQGVILVGIMSVLMTEHIQVLNGIKNVLGTVVNLVAALIFIGLRGPEIDWIVVVLIGIGGFAGGFLGAHIGRRLNPNVLRGVIVLVGVIAIARMTVFK